LFKKLSDKLTKLLMASSLIVVLAQVADNEYDKGFLDCAVMLFTVCIITMISVLSEWKCEKNLKIANHDVSDIRISVYRGTKDPISIQSEDLVVGDVIRLEKGMVIPADCILIHAGHPMKEISWSYGSKATWNTSEMVLVYEFDLTREENYKVKMPIPFTSFRQYQDAYVNCKNNSSISNVLFAQTCIA